MGGKRRPAGRLDIRSTGSQRFTMRHRDTPALPGARQSHSPLPAATLRDLFSRSGSHRPSTRSLTHRHGRRRRPRPARARHLVMKRRLSRDLHAPRRSWPAPPTRGRMTTHCPAPPIFSGARPLQPALQIGYTARDSVVTPGVTDPGQAACRVQWSGRDSGPQKAVRNLHGSHTKATRPPVVRPWCARGGLVALDRGGLGEFGGSRI
jgi:hypothetical protein